MAIEVAPRRLSALDGLRTLAVGAVFVFHARPQTFSGGMIGVTVFFVLSGFLITGLLLDEHADRSRVDLRGFYLRRTARLLPALGVAIVVAAPAIAVGKVGIWEYLRSAAAAVFYVSDFYAAATGGHGPLEHTWSLAVEEQFYVLWPLLLTVLLWRAGSRRAVAGVALAGFAALALAKPLFYMATGPTVYFLPWAHLDALLLGSALAVGARERWQVVTAVQPWMAWPCLAILTAALFGLHRSTDPRLWWGGLTIVAIAAAALVAALLQGGAAERLLSMRWLVWAGKRSYGMYLFHMPLLITAYVVFPDAWMAVVATAVLTVALAGASYRWIEVPSIGWTRRRSGHRDAVPSADIACRGAAVGGEK